MEGDGRLACSATGADLSEMAGRQLRSIATSSPHRPVSKSKVQWGRGWHCPVDGSRMEPANGFVSCTVCDRSLPEPLLYQLLKGNYHPRTVT